MACCRPTSFAAAWILLMHAVSMTALLGFSFCLLLSAAGLCRYDAPLVLFLRGAGRPPLGSVAPATTGVAWPVRLPRCGPLVWKGAGGVRMRCGRSLCGSAGTPPAADPRPRCAVCAARGALARADLPRARAPLSFAPRVRLLPLMRPWGSVRRRRRSCYQLQLAPFRVNLWHSLL